MLGIHEADIFYPPDYDELLYIIWDGEQRAVTPYQVALVYRFIKDRARRVYLQKLPLGQLSVRWKHHSKFRYFTEGEQYPQFKLYSDGTFVPLDVTST